MTPARRGAKNPAGSLRQPGRGIAVYLSIATVGVFIAACASLQKEPDPPPKRTVEIDVPTIEAVAETSERQEYGGISIEVKPVGFSVQPDSVCTYRAFDEPIFYVSGPEQEGVSSETHTPIHEVKFPDKRLDRDDVTFEVTLVNKMERVWRTEGAVIQVAIDGEVEAVEPPRYEELVTELLPPGQTRSHSVPVIEADRLPQEAAIELFLFDVVTDIDEAGNITERHNFEWSFEVTHEAQVDTVTGFRTNWWVSNSEANAIIRAQGRGDEECWSHNDWSRF